MFIVVFLSIIKTGVNYKIYSFNDYKVSNLAYIIFFSIRSYLILNMLVIIMVSIYRLLNEILVILTNGFILVSIPALSNTITSSKITSVFNLPLYYGKYVSIGAGATSIASGHLSVSDTKTIWSMGQSFFLWV